MATKRSGKRWLRLGLGLLLLLLVMVFAVAMNSGVQTSFARGMLLKADPNAKLESVSFGFGGGSVRGLDITVGGTTVKAGELLLKFGLWNMLFGNVRVIDDLQATDLVLDLTQTAAKGNTTTEATAKKEQAAPTPLLVKNADISCTLLLPDANTAQLQFKGHDLGAGGKGQATGVLVFRDSAPGAKVSEMRAEAQLDLTCTPAMFPENVNLTANLSAVVAGQAQPSRLLARLEAKPRNDKEGEFSLLLSDPVNTGAATPALLSITGNYGAGGSAKGSFAADLERAKIEPFALGLPLPDFTLLGSGEWLSNGMTGEISVKGKLQGHVGRLGVLRPNLDQFGSVKVDADVDVAWAKGKFTGRVLTATLAPEGGATAVSLNLLTPFTAVQEGKALKLTQGAGVELVRLTLDNAPVAWLASCLPANFTLTGRTISGEIVAGRREDGSLQANTTKPLTATGLALSIDGQPHLGGADVEFDSSFVYEPGEQNSKLLAVVRKLLCAADTVPMPTGVLKRSVQQGSIITAQYAGNVTATLGAGRPEFGGAGRLAVALDIDQVDRQALGTDLPSIMPNGRMLFDATFDAAQGAKSWDLAALQANLTKGTTLLASVKAAQKISLSLTAEGKPDAIRTNGDLAALDLSGFPLTLLQPFLGKDKKITGMAEKGRIIFVGGGEAGLDVRTEQPVSITNVLYADGGQTKFSGVTLTLTPTATWRTGELTSKTILNASVAAGVLVRATVEYTTGPEQWSANVTADGRLAAVAAQPFAVEWREMLPSPAPEYTLSAHIARTTNTLTIESATARILPPGGSGSAIGEARLMQTVKLNSGADGKYAWPKLEGDTAAIKLNNVPVGVVGLFVPGCVLQGRGITGDVIVRGDGAGGYTMSANSNVTVGSLTLTKAVSGQERAPWLSDLTINVRPTVKFNDTGVTYFDARGLDLSSGAAQIGQGDIEMTFSPGRAWWQQLKASLRADLGLLLKQPLMSGFNNLADGTLQLDAETGADGAIRLNAKATSWKIRTPNVEVRAFALNNVAGKFDAEKGALQLAGTLTGQSLKGATDCAFSVALGPTGPARSFSFSLTGSGLVADDLQALYSGLSRPPENSRPPGAPAPAAAPTAIGPDKAAFWGSLQGRAQVQLQRLVYGGFTLTDLQAGVDVTPTRISLPAISARFFDAPVKVSGTVLFDPAGGAQPYQLQASMALQDFDVGQYFRNRSPNAKPPAEGKFSVSGTAAGRGANAGDLVARVPFEVNLGSNGGVFHILDLVKNKNAVAGTAISVGQGLASIAGSLLGQKVPVAGQGLALFNELLTSLEAVTYNQLVFVAKRGADADVNITQFEVRSPVIQLVGTGVIKYVPNLALPDQPLTATLQLNATGRPAQILSSAGLMRAGNVQGYQPGPQFEVTGSLQNVNYDSLYTLLFRGIVGGVTNMIR